MAITITQKVMNSAKITHANEGMFENPRTQSPVFSLEMMLTIIGARSVVSKGKIILSSKRWIIFTRIPLELSVAYYTKKLGGWLNRRK
jgi:hypothetical protein